MRARVEIRGGARMRRRLRKAGREFRPNLQRELRARARRSLLPGLRRATPRRTGRLRSAWQVDPRPQRRPFVLTILNPTRYAQWAAPGAGGALREWAIRRQLGRYLRVIRRWAPRAMRAAGRDALRKAAR